MCHRGGRWLLQLCLAAAAAAATAPALVSEQLTVGQKLLPPSRLERESGHTFHDRLPPR